MMPSNKARLDRTPKKWDSGWRGQPSWERLRDDSDALSKELKDNRTPFLPGMLKLCSYATFLVSILQEREVRNYLMANHQQTFKALEVTLGLLQEQAKWAESQEISMWSIAAARKQLQVLVARARSTEPQVIGRFKTPLVVVISARRWKAILKRFPQAERVACPKVNLSNLNEARRPNAVKIGKPPATAIRKPRERIV